MNVNVPNGVHIAENFNLLSRVHGPGVGGRAAYTARRAMTFEDMCAEADEQLFSRLKPATDEPGCPAGLPGRTARPGNPVVIFTPG